MYVYVCELSLFFQYVFTTVSTTAEDFLYFIFFLVESAAGLSVNVGFCVCLWEGVCVCARTCERSEVNIFTCFFPSHCGRWQRKKEEVETRRTEQRNQGEIREKTRVWWGYRRERLHWAAVSGFAFTKEKFEEDLKKKKSKRLWGIWRFLTP